MGLLKKMFGGGDGPGDAHRGVADIREALDLYRKERFVEALAIADKLIAVGPAVALRSVGCPRWWRAWSAWWRTWRPFLDRGPRREYNIPVSAALLSCCCCRSGSIPAGAAPRPLAII
jgi:hypothetical protein